MNENRTESQCTHTEACGLSVGKIIKRIIVESLGDKTGGPEISQTDPWHRGQEKKEQRGKREKKDDDALRIETEETLKSTSTSLLQDIG